MAWTRFQLQECNFAEGEIEGVAFLQCGSCEILVVSHLVATWNVCVIPGGVRTGRPIGISFRVAPTALD